ncbi:hypothetical protein J2X31_003158 [Flavobacterium arsenatis]|uniref:Uncharacterized protein n=1 Tax=Flavobacterium arsenatis TaxID=1484332 RepID=A0ABU1TTC3_9FLAO|nr:DUF6770 family protein [Flavobacterium arsenatis]MDR6969131.1 hypothetical protein [Flavobacterium arsenatis]
MNIKNNIIVLFFITFICSMTMEAQIQKMSDLSENKYLGLTTIYDDKGDDVWGYLSLYQKDKVEKNFLELEYVILDKNLNRVGSNTFTQFYVNTWLIDVYPSVGRALKKQNILYLSIHFSGFRDVGSMFFRKINLDDFSISDCEVVEGSQKKQFTDDKTFGKLNKIQSLYSLGRYGYIGYNGKNKSDRYGNFYLDVSDFEVYDIDLNKKWSLVYEKTKKIKEEYAVARVSEKYLVLQKSVKSKENKNKWHSTLEVYEINNGNKILTIERKDNEYLYAEDRLAIKDDQLIIYDMVFSHNKKEERNYNSILGYSKREYDLVSKTLTDQKTLKWEAFKGHLNIDQFGKIDGDFYIHPTGITTTSTGKTVMVYEGFKPTRNTHILDLYMVELDEEFKVRSFLKINKFKNKINKLEAYGKYLQSNGYFDYLYAQKIKGDDYAYFYQDNEKEMGLLTKLKANNWVLGIVTYSEGQFSLQKINLKTGEGKISTMSAKNGYILLREVTDKETELRLEKINY